METASSTTTYDRSPMQFSDKIDCVLRVQTDDTEGAPYVAYIAETSKFIKKYSEPFFENAVMVHALQNLWLTHQYNQEYISFLLKACSQEEFLSKAAEYAKSFQQIDPRQLSLAANILLEKLNQPLTSAQLSLLLNVEPSSIEDSDLALIENTDENRGGNQDA